jgi:hypothetical protein
VEDRVQESEAHGYPWPPHTINLLHFLPEIIKPLKGQWHENMARLMATPGLHTPSTSYISFLK